MKKFLALILSVLLLFVGLPFAAMADDEVVEPAADATVSYYVDDVQDGEAVTGLFEGDAYAPDRMPGEEAPEGKYFAGWTDAAGNYILKDGITLAAGENKLYAKYVDYPGRNTSSGALDYINNPTFALGSFNASGENYLNYVDGTGDFLAFSTVELDGEKVWKLNNENTYGSLANFIIPNADGSAMQIEPGNKYTITITYKVPSHTGKNPHMFFGGGLAYYNEEKGTDNRLGLKTAYQGIVKKATSLTSTSDPNLSTTGEWVNIVLSNGHNRYLIKGASTEWQTATYTLNAVADYTGFLPVIQGFIHLPGSYEMYIKEIVVDNPDWIAPATVSYFVGDEQDGEAVTGLKEGDVFNPDRMPAAEAEDGKYFAGWTDAEGNYILKDGITLAAGTNELYAKYVDYPTGNTSSGALDYINNPTFALGSVNANGENYLNYVDGTGDYLFFSSVELEGEKVWKLSNENTYGSRANFIIPNADGSAMQIEPGQTYDITMTYMVPQYINTISLTFAGGLAYNKIDGTDNRLGLKTPYQGIAKNPATLTATSDSNLPLTSTGWAHIWIDSGHHQWGITGASEEWQTATFRFAAADDYTGFLPVIQGAISLPASSQMYIKEFVVEEHIHDWQADPENDKAPTCVEAGKVAYKCECGATKFEEGEAATGEHLETEEVVTLKPQVGVAGSKDIVCTVCGTVLRTEEIPALNFVLGDVDGSGGAPNAADLALLKKVIAGLTSVDDEGVVNPDVDGEGEIPNAADLALLKKIIAGLV